MDVPAHIAEGLRNVRGDLHLRWNPAAVKTPTGFDAWGKPKKVKWEGRFELWDKDPQGREYFVMRVQDADGGFQFPTERFVEHVGKMDPARYGGSVQKMLQALMDDPEATRELAHDRNFEDLTDAIVKWAQWVGTPKSGAHLANRGPRLFS